MNTKVKTKVIEIIFILILVNAFIVLGFILDGHFDLLMSHEYLIKLIGSDIIIGLVLCMY